MKSTLFTLLLAISFTSIFAQGKLLLVGGGGEGNWSDPAYRWGVESAANQKVGIVSFSSETEALPNYFRQLGAVEATNIRISSAVAAQSDTLYDYLMGFDFLFFKGGDQSNYYRNYKDTEVSRAMADKFAEGGVLGGTSAGMAILTGIMFSANNGTVYPDEGMLNIGSNRLTLHNDFLQVLPGYLGDTHFIERGRPFRLISFMARWYRDEQALVTGIGVDDQTAIYIDEDQVGTVVGTGAVSFYQSTAINFSGQQFYADSIRSSQLINGQRYDFSIGQPLDTGPESIAAEAMAEAGNFTLFLSGGQRTGDIHATIDALMGHNGAPNNSVLVVSESEGMAGPALQRLRELGAAFTLLATDPTNNLPDSAMLRNHIRQSGKVLFYRNDHSRLQAFLVGGATGELLKAHLRRNQMAVAFIGNDAPLAGGYYCTNNLTDNSAAYRNRLEYERGLGLLPASVVMPNTIDRNTSDFYENNTSAVLFALAKYKLRFGWYLNAGSCLKIHPENGNWVAEQQGDYPSVLLSNLAENGGFAQGRGVIAADRLNYQVLINGQQVGIGTYALVEQQAYSPEEPPVLANLRMPDQSPAIYPNPTKGTMVVAHPDWSQGHCTITDVLGKVVWSGAYRGQLRLGGLRAGVYVVTLDGAKGSHRFKAVLE